MGPWPIALTLLAIKKLTRTVALTSERKLASSTQGGLFDIVSPLLWMDGPPSLMLEIPTHVTNKKSR